MCISIRKFSGAVLVKTDAGRQIPITALAVLNMLMNQDKNVCQRLFLHEKEADELKITDH